MNLCQGGTAGQPGNSDVGLSHVFTSRTTRGHRRAFLSLPLSTVPLVLLRAEGTWALSLVARGSSCESPLVPRASVCPSRLRSLFRLWIPPRSVASVLCCLPRVSSCPAGGLRIHPGYNSSSRIRSAVFKFTGRSEGLPCPLSLYSQLHGPEDLVQSALSCCFIPLRCQLHECDRTLFSWFLPSLPTRVQLTVHMLSWCAW